MFVTEITEKEGSSKSSTRMEVAVATDWENILPLPLNYAEGSLYPGYYRSGHKEDSKQSPTLRYLTQIYNLKPRRLATASLAQLRQEAPSEGEPEIHHF